MTPKESIIAMVFSLFSFIIHLLVGFKKKYEPLVSWVRSHRWSLLYPCGGRFRCRSAIRVVIRMAEAIGQLVTQNRNEVA